MKLKKVILEVVMFVPVEVPETRLEDFVSTATKNACILDKFPWDIRPAIWIESYAQRERPK